MEAQSKFKAGSTYWGRFVTDADSHHAVKIERRTAKSVWVKDFFTQEIVRKSIKIHDGVETFKIISTMTISAEREA